jgi:cytosine/adenosine deaminase-related metal-dependent hydrolase
MRLSEIGVIGRHLVVAHALLATDHELTLLGKGQSAVAHSAIECLNILNAVPNVRLMRELGITVGLGPSRVAAAGDLNGCKPV